MGKQAIHARRTDDVTLGEVARTLGISRSTAWTRCLRGLIPAEWRGGRYVVKRRALARLAASNRNDEPTAA